MNKQIKINLNGVEVMATVTQEEYDKAYPKVRKYGRVGEGKRYYYSAFGSVRINRDDRDSTDNRLFETGEYHLTAEEAIKDDERKKAHMRIIRRIEELNDGWEPDFEDEDEDKFYIVYHHKHHKLSAESIWRIQARESCSYLQSMKIAKQMIKEHGDDYKLLWGIV